MSAPLAGKFQDHYEVLGVEINAELSTIERVYYDLAQKFDPRNPETGSLEKLEAVQLAYDILSDSTSRKEFDKLKGVGEEKSGPKFSGIEFFDALEQENSLRAAVLSVLYDRRRSRPFTPSLSMRHLESILAVGGDQLVFALWYLKQRGFVSSDDKSSLQISVEGMEYLENNRPSPEAVMSWIKPAALVIPQASAVPQAPAPPQASAVALAEGDPHRSAVNRILARGTN